jgi:pimeloyl-ACP methyl ester carboxylesterase
VDYKDAVAPMGGSARLSTAQDTDSAIIFVHGFRGHPLKTWGALPEMARTEGGFWEKADLYFFPYKAEKLHVDQSAHKLRKFVSLIFPSPPVQMFSRSLKDYDWTLSLLPRLPTARVRPGPYNYSKLYLVGHSLGGLIIRRFVADELQPFVSKPDKAPVTSVLLAQIRLFAPAHLGFKPSGWTGAAFNVSQQFVIGRILEAAMYRYRAYAHLHPKSRTIIDLRQTTEALASRYPSIASLSAHLLWGEEEQVVETGRYTCDLAINEHYEPRMGHLSVCKPSDRYHLPFIFIEKGVVDV